MRKRNKDHTFHYMYLLLIPVNCHAVLRACVHPSQTANPAKHHALPAGGSTPLKSGGSGTTIVPSGLCKGRRTCFCRPLTAGSAVQLSTVTYIPHWGAFSAMNQLIGGYCCPLINEWNISNMLVWGLEIQECKARICFEIIWQGYSVRGKTRGATQVIDLCL